MPHIFRFHAGRNNNIYDWKSSDRINSSDVKDVQDKSNIITSSAGTSIPSPIARMFLFKTAFEIVAAQVRDNKVDTKSIYSGLVSESLDLLELLYKNGSDESRFSYKKWIFDNRQQDDNIILNHFGSQHGHHLLAESFKQAASSEPFNNIIEITLIFYHEGNNKILVGGTSPFTFVFTSPNFRRKLLARKFRPISGLVSEDCLFDANYKQLQERDETFIKYIESLVTTPGISNSFNGFSEFVINTKARFDNRFSGQIVNLQDIHIGDLQLGVAGVSLKQVKPESHQKQISQHSDFKMELPSDSSYAENSLKPLFLLDRMDYIGQYTSTSSFWSNTTRIIESQYPASTLTDIHQRELPGMDGILYPFLTSFDIFERCLVKLPGYLINENKFRTLIEDQNFALPLKPIFFQFFPAHRINEYLKVEVNGENFTFILRIPITGATKGRREIIYRKTYTLENSINYNGILGIFPFTRASQPDLLHINKYTVASYEKTNSINPVSSIRFFKKTGIDIVSAIAVQRSNYSDINTVSKYFQIGESFEIVQVNFTKDNSNCGCMFLPIFQEVYNGTEEYVYAIDFGTSNTHIEYGKVENDKVSNTESFAITENEMQMFLLHKPKSVVKNDGAIRYNDYEKSMGTTVDGARQITLREFLPFQIGSHNAASNKFPFRTATCESNAFISNQENNRLFVDANIGFNIDEDSLRDDIRYKTNLKWLLQKSHNDQFNKNRISIFFRELLLMIRTKVLLQENNFTGDINKIKIALSFPISMGDTLKNLLLELFNEQKSEIFGINSCSIVQVTESIAPYYQLRHKNPNIQNDSFCNIDIGGGTTDIVLIDIDKERPNELLCFCSSFRFAGKQLWGSGSNEFNLSDNGFITFYKDYIQKNDPRVYKQLEKILNSNSTRTEDVLGLLFSRPEYKFIDIFTENTEFKAVLLIHYSAILYYISRLAKYTEIELPRTVSFSGKGSEYLNLIFPNNDDLKSYTQRVLGIFAGVPVRTDFIIERSKEPKVITAKGSAHFATEKIENDEDAFGVGARPVSNEKKLVLQNCNYKGFENFDLERLNLTYNDILENDDYFNEIIKTNANYFTMLFDDLKLCEAINKKLQLKDFAKYKEYFIPKNEDITQTGKLRDSFKSTLNNLDLSDRIDDSPFFFPLNYSLIELSKAISLVYKKQ